jgi:hypothetical protein
MEDSMSVPRSRSLAAVTLMAATVAGYRAPSAAQPSAGVAAPIAVGQPFPNLVLPDAVDGRARSIAEFRGEKLILHIFASW